MTEKGCRCTFISVAMRCAIMQSAMRQAMYCALLNVMCEVMRDYASIIGNRVLSSERTIFIAHHAAKFRNLKR